MLPLTSRHRATYASRWVLVIGAALVAAVSSCAGSASPPPAGPSPAESRPNLARGGRLYDNWVSEKNVKGSFSADSSKTAELDGRGGPNGNGTLDDGRGIPLVNTGHDYRLKNLFGWDLRGTAGIYGASYQNKPYVLGTNLLEDPRGESELLEWLKRGDDRVPAYGAVLDERDLRDVTAFIVAMRKRLIPAPTDIFVLDEKTPKNYRLVAGADAQRGTAVIGLRCAKCHGANGTKFAIDESESIGTISRSSGYEIWLKILNGHPGSPMKAQVHPADGAGPEQAKLVVDVLAALCDRSAYPKLPNGSDVADGDPRCGAYLR